MSINIATPEVAIIGESIGYRHVMEELGMVPETDIRSALSTMEFAGRGCYQSFRKPNPATRANYDYLKNIINQEHESVLEHATVTFYITGVSRALTHELVRHRMFNFSQQSQRFVNEEDARVVLPPAIAPDSEGAGAIRRVAEKALEEYREIVAYLQPKLEAEGVHPFAARKQAREAARAVLPNCIETKITVTGNHRALRNFLWRRMDPSADLEIRNLAQLMLDRLIKGYPALYEDIQAAFSEEVDNS